MKIEFEIPDKHSKEIHEAVESIKASAVDKINAVCFWLIKQCEDTNSRSMKIKQEGVHHFGKLIGNFEITIKKIK